MSPQSKFYFCSNFFSCSKFYFSVSRFFFRFQVLFLFQVFFSALFFFCSKFYFSVPSFVSVFQVFVLCIALVGHRITPNLIFFNLMEYCQNKSRGAVRPNGPCRSDFSIVVKQNMHVSDDWYYTTDCRDVRENTTRYLFMFLFLKTYEFNLKPCKTTIINHRCDSQRSQWVSVLTCWTQFLCHVNFNTDNSNI